MIATDCLDEPLLTTDPALEDSAPPTVSSRTLNNALEYIYLLAVIIYYQ